MSDRTNRISHFQQTVWQYYDAHGRHGLPWRQPGADGSFDPYKIMVSEVMLQQTQVSRVMPKYADFLERFPDVDRLAAASLGEVLVVWQGLGYNRRAKFLRQAAAMVVDAYGGSFPRAQAELARLPGVGSNTAGAIAAYAFNQPSLFVETNIRTVYIHHFFEHKSDIHDREILELVGRSLPAAPAYRDWYWALMDYGSHLKQTVGNKSRTSRSYVRQSPFQGSRRQVRGAVIRELGRRPLDLDGLRAVVADRRLDEVLADLEREGMIVRQADGYRLS